MIRCVYGIFFIYTVAWAGLPIDDVAGLSDALGEKDEKLSIINGIIDGGKVYNYYFYGKDDDKNHLLARALFHNYSTQLFPKILDLSASFIAKIVLEINKLDLDNDLEDRLEEIFSENKGFEDSLTNYPKVQRTLFSAKLLPMDRVGVKDFIGFLTATDATVILQSFLWLKTENKRDLKNYYRQLGVELDHSWESFSFSGKGKVGLDSEVYETLKLTKSEISLVPVGIANVNGKYFVDSICTCLRNFFIILFYNNGNYKNIYKIKGLNEIVVNYFKMYPTEKSQFSQEARDSWAELVTRVFLPKFDVKKKESSEFSLSVLFFVEVVINFFSVESWAELNKIIESIERYVDLRLRDGIYGANNINISVGSSNFKLELRPKSDCLYFTINPVSSLDLDWEIRSAWRSKKLHVFKLLPNTARKMILISESLQSKTISIDEGLSLLGPIHTFYQAFEIANFLLAKLKISWPVEFAAKLYQSLSEADYKFQFLSQLHPEQRIELLRKVGKDGFSGLGEDYDKAFLDALFMVLDTDTPEYLKRGFLHYRYLDFICFASEYKYLPYEVLKVFDKLVYFVKGYGSISADYLARLFEVSKNLEKNNIVVPGLYEVLREKVLNFKDREDDLKRLLLSASAFNDLEGIALKRDTHHKKSV